MLDEGRTLRLSLEVKARQADVPFTRESDADPRLRSSGVGRDLKRRKTDLPDLQG